MSRFRIYEAEKTMIRLTELAMPRTEFATQWANVESPFTFITEDEINAALAAGSNFQGSKGRIFLYYQEQHSANEQIKFAASSSAYSVVMVRSVSAFCKSPTTRSTSSGKPPPLACLMVGR